MTDSDKSITGNELRLEVGVAYGWSASQDGQWTAFYGSHSDGGRMGSLEDAQRVAQEWMERARWRWGTAR